LSCLPLTLFLQLPDLALDDVALEHAQMLNKQNAIQVVDFMTEGPCQKIFAADLEWLALYVVGSYGDELGSHDIAPKTGNRQATLFFAFFAFEVNDFGIGQHDFRFGIFSAGDVHNGQPQAQTDLRSREPDSRCGVHGREHILGQLSQCGVELLHWRSRLFQNRVAVFDDGIDLALRRLRAVGALRFLNLGGFGRGLVRTRRFVGHNFRNSAASRRANLLRIFAEKRPPGQVRPCLRLRLPPPGPRTSRSARKPPESAVWSPDPLCPAADATSRWA